MKTITSTLICAATAIALCCIFGTQANAQERGKIAICPAVYDNGSGTPAAQAEALHAMRATLEGAGFTVVDYDSGKSTWSGLGISMPVEGQAPASTDLARFGKAAGADFVIAPEFDFDANRTWNVGHDYTTVKAAMNIFSVADGSMLYTHTETLSKTTQSPGDFATLSKSNREERVVDEAVGATLAGFTRLMKLVLH